MTVLTQVLSVVDRVADQEHGEEGGHDRLSAGVLAVEVTSLDSAASLLRSIALGQALVESYDRLHARRRATGTRSRLGRGNLRWDGESRVEANAASDLRGRSGLTECSTGEHCERRKKNQMIRER